MNGIENILPETRKKVAGNSIEIHSKTVQVNEILYTFDCWADTFDGRDCIVIDATKYLQLLETNGSTFYADTFEILKCVNFVDTYLFIDGFSFDSTRVSIKKCILKDPVFKEAVKSCTFHKCFLFSDLGFCDNCKEISFHSCHILGSIYITAPELELNIRDCRVYNDIIHFNTSIENLIFVNTEFFKEINLHTALINNVTLFDIEIMKGMSFEGTIFNSVFSASLININSNSYDSVISLKNCILKNGAKLTEAVNCNFDFSNAVINGEVCFQNNNLSDSRFDNVDLSRNFRFNNVRWHPDGEIRGKLKLEEDARAAAEPEEKKRKLNQALKHYHELVIYYDSTRDIEQSERFFISEMELRKELSESWWEKRAYELYSIYSVYGTSWKRALFMLFVTLMFVVPLVLFVNDIIFTNKTDLTGISRYIEDSFRLLMLQKGVYDGVSGTKFFLQAISQLALLGQTALLFLAIRRHFRRSPSASQ